MTVAPPQRSSKRVRPPSGDVSAAVAGYPAQHAQHEVGGFDGEAAAAAELDRCSVDGDADAPYAVLPPQDGSGAFTPDLSLRRIRTHALLFGACHGTVTAPGVASAALCVPTPSSDGSDGSGEDEGSSYRQPSARHGAATYAHAAPPQEVWHFLRDQAGLDELVTCNSEEAATPTSWEVWAFGEFNCALGAHFSALEAFGLHQVAAFPCGPTPDVAAALAASLPPDSPHARLVSALLARPFSRCDELEVGRFRYNVPPFLHGWARRFGVDPHAGGAQLLAVTGVDSKSQQCAKLYVPIFPSLQIACAPVQMKLGVQRREKSVIALVRSLETADVRLMPSLPAQVQSRRSCDQPEGRIRGSTNHGGNAFLQAAQDAAAQDMATEPLDGAAGP